MINDRDRVQSYIARFKSAKSIAEQWRGLFLEAYSYAMPNRNLFSSNYTIGAKKNTFVYDTTAEDAVQSFASMIGAALTPPDTQWAQLDAGYDVPDEDKATVAREMQKATDILFRYIRASNFDLAIYESYYDLSIGTGAIMVTEGDSDDRPFCFDAVPLFDFFPEEGPRGTIDTAWRQWCNVPSRNIKRIWPHAEITPELQMLIDKSDIDKIFSGLNFAEGVVFNEGASEDKQYTYTVICLDTGDEIVYEECESSPWIVYRWSKLPTEIYGRGPVISALPSIESLNKVAEFELKAAAFRACPVYMGFSDDVFNPFNTLIRPNTIIPINRSSATQLPLMPLPRDQSDPQFNQLIMADLRQQINNLMFSEPFGAQNAPVKTATEITARQQMLMQKIGPAFGRLQVELLQPLIKRCLYILTKRGSLPPIKVNNKIVAISFNSPLAQATGLQKALNFQQYYGALAQMFGPQLAMQGLNVQNIPEYLAELYNVDLGNIKNPQEIQQVANMAAKLGQQQQAAQIAQSLPQSPSPGLAPNVQQSALQTQGALNDSSAPPQAA